MIRANYNTTRRVLILTASNEARAALAYVDKERGYYGAEALVSESLHEEYEFIPPEEIGALTDAPILVSCADITYQDDGERALEPSAKVFWFPSYAVIDPWQALRQHGRVEFTEAT